MLERLAYLIIGFHDFANTSILAGASQRLSWSPKYQVMLEELNVSVSIG